MRKTQQFAYSGQQQNFSESGSKLEERNAHQDSQSKQNNPKHPSPSEKLVDLPSLFQLKNSDFSIFPKRQKTDLQLHNLIKWKRSSLSKQEPQNIKMKQLQQMKELYSDWKKYLANQQEGSLILQVDKMIRRMVYYRSQMIIKSNNGFWLHITNSNQDKYKMVVRNCRGEILLYTSQVKKINKLKQIRDIINNKLTEKSLCFIVDETVKSKNFVRQIENPNMDIVYFYRCTPINDLQQQSFIETSKFISKSTHLMFPNQEIQLSLEYFDKLLKKQNQFLQEIRGKKSVQNANITFDAMLVNLWKAQAFKAHQFNEIQDQEKKDLNIPKKIYYIVEKLMHNKIYQLQKIATMKPSQINKNHYPQLIKSCKSCKVCKINKEKNIIFTEINSSSDSENSEKSSNQVNEISKALNSTNAKAKYRCRSCSDIYGVDVTLCPHPCYKKFHIKTQKYLKHMKLRSNRKTPFDLNKNQEQPEQMQGQPKSRENRTVLNKQLNEIDHTSNQLFSTINELIENQNFKLAQSSLKLIGYQVTDFLLQLNGLKGDQIKNQANQ